MAEAELQSIDPTIQEPTPVQQDADFAEHTGTYNGFVHLAMWFVVHMALLLIGLYVVTLGGLVAGGVAIIAIAIAALIYGIVSTPAAAH